MKSINPFNNQLIREYKEHNTNEVGQIISKCQTAWLTWKGASFGSRKKLMLNAASVLRSGKEDFARLITIEMGKIIRESLAEIEKCALVCEYYANNAEEFLKDEPVVSDASRSFIAFQPIGIVLAVMPWNFPFWQVFRYAAPALMAGNAGLLKHASNVPGCSLAIEEVFKEAGFPAGLFRSLMIPSTMVEGVISHPHVAAVTLTGSEYAGSRVAAAAGKNIRKSVLELGGSDPFIVLDDADIDAAVKTAVVSRLLNQGQSCIAAKRFIVMDKVVKTFEEKITSEFRSLKTGDPMDISTQTGPLARQDLVEEIDRQVKRSVAMGARLIAGGHRIDLPGFFYSPTILGDVKKGMPVYEEETFGPVLAIIPVKDEEEAITVANDSEFGLGGAVWTRNTERGESVARKVETGAMFVNGLVKSDPRIPFGGIKKSGYGRELGVSGIREFVNVKSIWIG